MKTEANYVKILTITQKVSLVLVLMYHVTCSVDLKFLIYFSQFCQVYLNVMQKECKIEQKYLQQMFPNLDRLIALHRDLLDDLMQKYQQSDKKFAKSIGDVLLEVFSNKSEMIIDIYSKICCTHLAAKSLYKQFSISNKSFIHFLTVSRLYY